MERNAEVYILQVTKGPQRLERRLLYQDVHTPHSPKNRLYRAISALGAAGQFWL